MTTFKVFRLFVDFMRVLTWSHLKCMIYTSDFVPLPLFGSICDILSVLCWVSGQEEASKMRISGVGVLPNY